LGGIQGWAQAVSRTQALAVFSARGSRVPWRPSRPIKVQDLRGWRLGVLGAARAEALMGPTRAWLRAPLVWFFGTWDQRPAASQSGAAPLILPPTPKAAVAAAYGCGQALPQQRGCGALEGQ